MVFSQNQKIQSETKTSIRGKAMNLKCLSPIEFFLLLRLPYCSTCKARNKTFFDYCKQYHILAKAKCIIQSATKNIKSETEAWIWVCSLRVLFVYCVDFHMIVIAEHNKRRLQHHCQQYKIVVDANERIQSARDVQIWNVCLWLEMFYGNDFCTVALTVHENRCSLVSSRHYYILDKLRVKIQSATKSSIQDRSMNSEFWSETDFSVLHWLQHGSTYNAQYSTLSSSL